MVSPTRRDVLLGTLFVVVATAVWARSRRQDSTALVNRVSAIEARHNISIRWLHPRDFVVSGSRNTVSDIPDATIIELQDTETLGVAIDAISGALDRYPEGFFARHCQAIFMCGELRLEGKEAGGTYGDRWLLLVANPTWSRAMISEANGPGLHHEFSSILYSSIPEIPLRWSQTLPSHWKFKLNNRDTLEARLDGPPDYDLGFLSAYGATTAENDFNVYAETLMASPELLKNLADSHPVVRRKTALLLDLYIRLDPRFRDRFSGSVFAPLLN